MRVLIGAGKRVPWQKREEWQMLALTILSYISLAAAIIAIALLITDGPFDNQCHYHYIIRHNKYRVSTWTLSITVVMMGVRAIASGEWGLLGWFSAAALFVLGVVTSCWVTDPQANLKSFKALCDQYRPTEVKGGDVRQATESEPSGYEPDSGDM